MEFLSEADTYGAYLVGVISLGVMTLGVAVNLVPRPLRVTLVFGTAIIVKFGVSLVNRLSISFHFCFNVK